MGHQKKSYKKFVATAATATLVASAIVPVASASFTDVGENNEFAKNINAAVEAGYVKGYEDGTFGVNDNLKRSQVVIIIGRYLEKLGYTSEKTTSPWSDVTDTEVIKYGNIVKDAGVFTGYADGTLNGAGLITRENMAVVLDRLAKTVTGTSLSDVAADIEDVKVADLATANTAYQGSIQALRDLGISTADNFNPKGNVKRGQFAKFIVTAVEKIDAIAQEDKEASELAVESVSAINAKQLQVKFTSPVNRLSAENKENYSLTGTLATSQANGTKAATAAAIESVHYVDATTVVVTLATTNDNPTTDLSFKNGEEYELTVLKDLKGATGSTLTENAKKKFSLTDTTIPTVKEVTTLTPSLLSVQFSEPVKGFTNSGAANAATYEVYRVLEDGKLDSKNLVTGSTAKATVLGGSNNTEATVSLSEPLSPGSTYRVYVNKNNSIEDFAGYKVPAYSKDIKLVQDTTVPQATELSELLEGKVALIKFNKYVSASAANFYWNTDGNSNNTSVGKATKAEYVGNNTYKVTFQGLLPAGKAYIFAANVKDSLGNPAPAARFEVNVNATEAPAVKEAKLISSTKVQVKFNEDIAIGQTAVAPGVTIEKARAYYELKDSKGNIVPIKNVTVGTKETTNAQDLSIRELEVYTALPEGKYTLTVKNIKGSLDRVINYTGDLTIQSIASFSPKFVGFKATADVNLDQFAVLLDPAKTLPVNSGDNSLLNKDNWTVKTAVGVQTLSSVNGATVTKVNDNFYMVSAPKNTLQADAVTITNLKTAAGAVIQPIVTTLAGKLKNTGATYMDLQSIAGADKFVTSQSFNRNQIVLTVNGLIQNVSTGDFTYTNDGKTVAINSITTELDYKEGQTKITFNTGDVDVTKVTRLATNRSTSTKDVFGNRLVANKSINLIDQVSANITKAYVAGNLNDALKGAQPEQFATNGAVTKVGIDASALNDIIVVEFDKALNGIIDQKDLVVKDKNGKTYSVAAVQLSNDSKKLAIAIAATTVLPTNGSEVDVTFTKAFSGANVANATVTTNSFYVSGLTFDKGNYAASLDGNEQVKLTFNQVIDPASYGDLPTTVTYTAGTGTNSQGTKASIDFGPKIGTLTSSLTGAGVLFNGISGASVAEVKATTAGTNAGKELSIRLSSLTDTNTGGTNSGFAFGYTPAATLKSVDGIYINPTVTVSRTMVDLLSPKVLTAVPVPDAALPTVQLIASNYKETFIAGAVNLTSANAAGTPVTLNNSTNTITPKGTNLPAGVTLAVSLDKDGKLAFAATTSAAIPTLTPGKDIEQVFTVTINKVSTDVTVVFKGKEGGYTAGPITLEVK